MNKRRNLLAALSVATLMPRIVFAQSRQPVLIGWLHTDSRELSANFLTVFKEGLTALGWKEDVQYIIEQRWASGRSDRLQSLAEELAALNPAIIVAAPSSAVRAAMRAAPTTPIVMGNSGDPIVTGLAKSLARPGGLVTGVTSLTPTLTEKYLELLLTAVPTLRGVGVLIDSNTPARVSVKQAVQRSAVQYKVQAHIAEVAMPEEIQPAISRLATEGAQGLIVTGGPMLRSERERIVKLALSRRWPMIAGPRQNAELGALLSYSADVMANYSRAAYFVDRILKGAKPADLPIEQPTRFVFVVNVKTAKALGITLPPEIMVRATKVIQ